MPLHTWADGDRLLAADLNSSFAWSQDQTIPGVISSSAAGNITLNAGAIAALAHAQPVAADDPLGFWRSGDGAFVIPTGLGGLYLYLGTLAATGTKSDQVRATVRGVSAGGFWGGLVKNAGTVGQGGFVGALGVCAAGAVVYTEAQAFDTNASNVRMQSAALVRLGRGLGNIGALMAAGAPADEVLAAATEGGAS